MAEERLKVDEDIGKELIMKLDHRIQTRCVEVEGGLGLKAKTHVGLRNHWKVFLTV